MSKSRRIVASSVTLVSTKLQQEVELQPARERGIHRPIDDTVSEVQTGTPF